jgi:transcriptional regulator with XRE-family HTH domain
MKRSQQKKITIQARTIRYMRVVRGISQREASRLCGLSESAIGHYEQGRMDISGERLVKFLSVIAFTPKHK